MQLFASVQHLLFDPAPLGLLAVSIACLFVAILRRCAEALAPLSGVVGMFGKYAALMGALLGALAVIIVYADPATSWQEGLFSWAVNEAIIGFFVRTVKYIDKHFPTP